MTVDNRSFDPNNGQNNKVEDPAFRKQMEAEQQKINAAGTEEERKRLVREHLATRLDIQADDAADLKDMASYLLTMDIPGTPANLNEIDKKIDAFLATPAGEALKKSQRVRREARGVVPPEQRNNVQ